MLIEFWHNRRCAGIDFVDRCGHEKAGRAGGCLVSRSRQIGPRHADAPHPAALDSAGIVRFVRRMGLRRIVDRERRPANSSASGDRHLSERHLFASKRHRPSRS